MSGAHIEGKQETEKLFKYILVKQVVKMWICSDRAERWAFVIIKISLLAEQANYWLRSVSRSQLYF